MSYNNAWFTILWIVIGALLFATLLVTTEYISYYCDSILGKSFICNIK